MTDLKTPNDHIILLPVDFSDSSHHALEYAVEMAQLFDNQITLLYVMSKGGLTSMFASKEQKMLVRDNIQAKLNEYKDEILSALPSATVNTMLDEGKAFKRINEIAEQTKCDTIVMGTNGVSGVEQFIGSTTSRVISTSKVPVIVVKEKRAKINFDDIVVPIDLSKESKQKLAWAVRLGKKYNSTIHIIMEVEKDEFLAKQVEANLNHAKRMMESNGVKYVAKLLNDRQYPDHIGMDTIQYAREYNADLIMIMTHAEGNFSEIFVGSYAQQVVNSVQKTAVMCINPKQTLLKQGGGAGFYS